MREGVEVVKMIFFKKLHSSLAAEYLDWDAKFCSMITGAVVNQIFGTTNDQEPFLSFNEENRAQINKEVSTYKTDLDLERIVKESDQPEEIKQAEKTQEDNAEIDKKI